MNAEPVTPTNEWACGLAALSWNLHLIGQPLNQEAIVLQIGANFPHWNHYLGLLEFHDIPRALKFLRIEVCRSILTDSAKELRAFYEANPNTFLMGFGHYRKPVSHIVGISGWDESEVTLMDSGRPAEMRTKTWNDLAQEHDANFLFLFHSGAK